MDVKPEWTWEEHQFSEGYSCVVYDEHGRTVAAHHDRATAAKIAAAPEQHDAHIKISEIANRVFQMGDAECRRALQEIHEISRAAISKATNTPRPERVGEK